LGLLLQLLALQAADVGATDSSHVSFWQRTIAAWRWAEHVSDGLIGDPRDSLALAEALLEKIRSDPLSIELAGPAPGRGALPASGDTSNLVLIDSSGSAVSLMQSVSAPFASGIVLGGTGVLLNNRMRGFNTCEKSVNCVAPGRRPAHTLVPAMIARDGRIALSIGTPGAAGQTITLAQVLVRILAYGQSAEEAITAPRWSVAPSGRIIIERTAPPSVVDELRSSEPDLDLLDVRNVRFGSVKAVWRDGSSVGAVADYRRVAAACAW
jgi:gamma-glutamyltranspeptidase/glutathione hydrolase